MTSIKKPNRLVRILYASIHTGADLFSAAREGNCVKVKQLLAKGASDSDELYFDGSSIISVNASFGHQELVALLMPGSSKRQLGEALWWAAKMGHPGVVEYILSHHQKNLDNLLVYRNSRLRRVFDQTALRVAAVEGHTNAVSLLLQYRDDKNSALLAAASGGQTPMVSALLKRGASLNFESCLLNITRSYQIIDAAAEGPMKRLSVYF